MQFELRIYKNFHFSMYWYFSYIWNIIIKLNTPFNFSLIDCVWILSVGNLLKLYTKYIIIYIWVVSKKKKKCF